MYETELQAQPGIYAPAERTITMYFAEPDAGIHKDTGVLLLFANYGESAMSDKYIEMREQLADTYNLVTVQCDYFGYEYMQNNIEPNITPEVLASALSQAELTLLEDDYEQYAHILTGKIFKQDIDLEETLENFNDMGLMQAMDNLRVMKVLFDILKNNKYQINENRIYAYGTSHGAYLAHLCNAFCPGLFTGMIDNSAYLTPYYFKNSRNIPIFCDNIHIEQIVNYKASEYIQDEEILSLPQLYEQFFNQAQIICYAGEEDTITTLEDKKHFANQIEHCKVETVTKYRIDKYHFKSAKHGLDADSLALFHHAYTLYLEPKEKERKKKKNKHQIIYTDMSFETAMFRYDIKWEDEIPILYRTEK